MNCLPETYQKGVAPQGPELLCRLYVARLGQDFVKRYQMKQILDFSGIYGTVT